MKLIAMIVLVWLVCLLAGAVFGVLGKVIWIAILASVIAAIWHYINKDKVTDSTTRNY